MELLGSLEKTWVIQSYTCAYICMLSCLGSSAARALCLVDMYMTNSTIMIGNVSTCIYMSMRDVHVHDKQYNHDRKCVYMYMSMRDVHVHVHDKQYNHDRKCVSMYMSMRDVHVHDKQHNKIHDRKCVYMSHDKQHMI